jgi:hypothetical protein
MMEIEKCVHSFSWKVRDHVKYLGLDGVVILKWILQKWDVREWTGFVWLRIWAAEPWESIRRFSRLSEALLGSQEGLCSIDFNLSLLNIRGFL